MFPAKGNLKYYIFKGAKLIEDLFELAMVQECTQNVKGYAPRRKKAFL
jgi:hypothetical protein